ncbi:NAD-dependent epimerase/dehydratase family protein [Acinetobacter sp. YH16037]|uniref:NAD-dependent epimerase/dehydratase family protein n=1 Tax=Acinetobacter sp. YH16037 TaxID=2601182 RepID=UPI0015D29C1E|nr:NAD-dependent epimerase/dehydratase family protein [Acinetobacter sp. YH16037]
MKVLVLGGTGAMGIHLCDMLVKGGHDVNVTSRTRSGITNSIRYIQGNAQEDTFLNKLLSQKWDVIVDFMVYSTPHFQKRYVSLLNNTNQYVFISSARVYANSEESITENSPRLLDVSTDEEYLRTDEYALSKARQEDLLFACKMNNWTIVRPYITYDNERLQLGALEKEDWLYRVLNGKSIITLKEMQNKKTTLTSGRDVARGILALLGSQNALGEAFHITSNISLTWGYITNIYINVLKNKGYNPNLIEDDLKSFSSWRKAKYQIYYDRLYDRTFNNDKINDFINTSEFIGCSDGLEECLLNFIDNQQFVFKPINWREEALKDKIAGEFTQLSEISSFKDRIKYLLFRTTPLMMTRMN